MSKARIILMATGIALAAFGLGVMVGWRRESKPAFSTDITQPPEPAREAAAPPAVNAPSAANAPPCVDMRDAATLVGKRGCVAALVLRVYSSRSGNTFLDFCQDYRTCPFTSVIFADDKAKFGNLEAMQGKRVEIRGDVVTYRGHPEIVIHDPQQVRGAR